ncbi:aldehyde dehydrogenase [Bradyrhizobium sp. 61]|uniref:aldehyde dehydrogenase n=1 Tax=unclassified Bradyrhizobium TaxID=2631580 RepID=UPI001FF9DE0F|nr:MULTISPECIES: aldehyde dehydrogenase [unclassified Bradyrhizobium]MCK1277428.1 aldehyde dehydrogenase [Bradyrhizobium sp. 61]MCK1447408.1 aldehyde dehydrogenase [Bradyrhizobium sp. 48]
MTFRVKHPDRLYIGGEWVPSLDGSPIDIVSPDTEQIVFRVAGAGPRDMDRAVAAAREAFDRGGWSTEPVLERIEAVQRLADALGRRAPELAAAWSVQMGGPTALASHVVGYGTQNLLDAIKIGREFRFEMNPQSAVATLARVVHDPVGVVAAITPWNTPYMLMTAKIAPALIAGCTVIMKPAPETPVEAYIIAECADEVGLPPGVLNLVPSEREAADHLMRNPGVDKIAFTGSTSVGRKIAQVCGESIRRCSLELGGKSAAIVLDDFSDEEAAKTLTNTIVTLSGQICAMLTRAIVPRHRHDAIADAVAAEMKQIRIGHSDDPEAQMGPLATKRQLERVEHYVATGVSEGATLVTGGARPPHLESGFFFEPTLFANVKNNMTIAQEEIFGPVLCLIACEDTDDAIRIANDSIYGLNASVLTHDADAAAAVARRLRVGNVAQNGLRADFSLPWGGFKQSGIGREGGEQGLSGYLETKTMLLDGKT